MGNKSFDTRSLTTYAMLMACTIVLSEYFALKTELIKIHFGFIPVIVSAILFGWKASTSIAGLADILGLLIFPQVGAPFLGFTATATLTGFTYGILLHKKDNSLTTKSILIRGIIASFIVTGIIYTIINSLMLGYLYNSYIFDMEAITAIMTPMMPARILKNIVLFAMQVVMIPSLFAVKDRIYTNANEITA